MKKITMLFAFVITSLVSNAQIAPGSVAPDFTATDINGVSHTLSTYLAAGKTVIMDVSATWCAPCWNYHNLHVLEDMYKAYGPPGSDELVVLFIEGDGSTPVADLYGSGSSQGDWVAGTLYPIIDSSTIANLYQIGYFPTVYRICPSGIVTETGQLSAVGMRNNLNLNCVQMTGVQNHVEVQDNTLGLCASTGSAQVKVKNFAANVSGVTPIVTINLLENGVVVGTKATAGTFAQFSTKTLTFDPITFNPTSTYTFEVANINGNPNRVPEYSTSDLTVTYPSVATENIVVKVYTDNYPSEASWKIKNSAGTVVATGGPYAGTSAGGGVDANTTKIHNVTLPTANECYSIELADTYGDGWGYGSTPHGLEIFDSNNTSVYNIVAGNFGTLLTKQNAVKTEEFLATTNFAKSNVSIYPNPSNGIFTISTQTALNVEVVDVLGKVVYSATDLLNDAKINLSSFAKGLYVAKITGENINFSEKLIVK